MTRVHRIDIGTLAPPIRREDGTLLAEARIAKTGVQVYRNADGTARREYRSPAEVFKTDSLATFRGRPLTHEHPPTMLNAENARQYAVGAVLDAPRQDGDYAVASISVYDAATIAAMQAGKNQVSCGYDVDLVEQPGTAPDGQHYDAIQTNIVGNHLAIVGSARAGKEAAVRMDAAYADDVLNAEARNALPAREFAAGDKLPIEDEAHVRAAMSRFSQTQFASDAEKRAAYHKIVAAAHKFGIDTTGFEQAHHTDGIPMADDKVMSFEEQVHFLKAKNEELTKRADSAEAEARKQRDRAEKAEQRYDVAEKGLDTERARHQKAVEIAEGDAVKKLQERADNAERELSELRASIPATVRARAELVTRASVLKCRADAAMPDRLIHEQMIKALEPSFKPEGHSDVQVAERANALYDNRMRYAESMTRVGEVLAPQARQATRVDSREARERAWHEQALNPQAFRAAYGLDRKDA